MSARVEVLVHTRPLHAEGPVWAHGHLYWVDILAGVLHRVDVDSGTDQEIPLGQELGAVAPTHDGGLVLALRDGFAYLGPDEGAHQMVAPVERSDHRNRMNDGKCDWQGRFWASTMSHDAAPAKGTLYCLDTDCSVRPVLRGLTVGNGPAWSRDGTTLYFTDSVTHCIDQYSFDTTSGAVSNRQRLIEIPSDEGVPDGMCIDAEGFLWVAMFGGWSVRRYSPAGTLDRQIPLPVANVTCPTFGGAHLDQLFVSTSADGLADADRTDQPLAGAIFRVEPGVEGLPAAAFQGCA